MPTCLLCLRCLHFHIQHLKSKIDIRKIDIQNPHSARHDNKKTVDQVDQRLSSEDYILVDYYLLHTDISYITRQR